MARDTMARLISEVRTMTGAPANAYGAGTATAWSDDLVQDILDRHRRDVVRLDLTPEPRLVGGGTLNYFDYRAPYGQWEATSSGGSATFVVRDSLGAVQGTALWSADYARGLVTFAANQGGTAYALTGAVFDLYGAAAEVLRQWATREARAYDFSEDGQSFRRSQKREGLLAMARDYERKAWAVSGALVRSDVVAGRWSRSRWGWW